LHAQIDPCHALVMDAYGSPLSAVGANRVLALARMAVYVAAEAKEASLLVGLSLAGDVVAPDLVTPLTAPDAAASVALASDTSEPAAADLDDSAPAATVLDVTAPAALALDASATAAAASDPPATATMDRDVSAPAAAALDASAPAAAVRDAGASGGVAPVVAMGDEPLDGGAEAEDAP